MLSQKAKPIKVAVYRNYLNTAFSSEEFKQMCMVDSKVCSNNDKLEGLVAKY